MSNGANDDLFEDRPDDALSNPGRYQKGERVPEGEIPEDMMEEMKEWHNASMTKGSGELVPDVQQTVQEIADEVGIEASDTAFWWLAVGHDEGLALSSNVPEPDMTLLKALAVGGRDSFLPKALSMLIASLPKDAVGELIEALKTHYDHM